VRRRVLWQADHQFGGAEVCELEEGPDGGSLAGTALTSRDGQPVRIEYRVAFDGRWRTAEVRVRVEGRGAARELALDADGSGGWYLDGRPLTAAGGALDVDLGWTPATNTLPIRRLGLAVGGAATIRAVWLRYPELEVVVADQRYERLADDRYRYSSGTFSAVLVVDSSGLVTDYEGIWRAVAIGA
jgi:hypothetical protein